MKNEVGRTGVMSCRDVLWILVFCGFGINYMLRINVNLTIVRMVPPKIPAASVECHNEGNSLLRWREKTWNSNDTITFPTTSKVPETVTYKDRFVWSEEEQGMILGGYYFLHWTTQLPGGLLAKRYGTKLVFGVGNLVTAVLGLLLPYAAYYHLYLLVLVRVLQGLISGFIWPSMHDMTAKWTPPNERSKFVSAYLGSSVGAAITFPLCGYTAEWFGWEFSFYLTSFIGIVWWLFACAFIALQRFIFTRVVRKGHNVQTIFIDSRYGFWWLLAYDSPREHPRISEAEKTYILDGIAGSVDDKKVEIPWKRILLSRPVWITIIAHWGSCWSFLTLLTQIPTYFANVHGLNVTTIALISGLPHLLRMIFSYSYSIMSDWFIRTAILSPKNVRKVAKFISTGLHGIMILALAMSGCHTTLAIIFMMLAVILNGAVSASTLAVFVDLSPNYGSVLLGICGLISTTSSVMSTTLVGILTQNNSTIGQWSKVYIITSIPSLLGCLVFIIWGVADQQPWNDYRTPINEREQGMKVLTGKSVQA